MAIDDLSSLRSELPDLFSDRDLPAVWEEQWIFVRIDDPEAGWPSSPRIENTAAEDELESLFDSLERQPDTFGFPRSTSAAIPPPLVQPKPSVVVTPPVPLWPLPTTAKLSAEIPVASLLKLAPGRSPSPTAASGAEPARKSHSSVFRG
jgi:hypothetical protein